MRSVRLRVGLAALAGLAAGEIVLAVLSPADAPLVATAIVAAIVTVAAAWIAALSITRPIERLAASVDGDRRFAAGGVQRDATDERGRSQSCRRHLAGSDAIRTQGPAVSSS